MSRFRLALEYRISTREFINMGIVRWIGVFCFLFVFSFSFSQSINDIKKKKERTEKEIAYLNKLLKEADKDKSATVEKLTIINQKISKGKEMLQSLRNEAAYLEKLIADNGLKDKIELAGTFCLGQCQTGVNVLVGDERYSVTPETVTSFFEKDVLPKLG